MSNSPPFKTGDRVRLTSGTCPIIVMEVNWFNKLPPCYAKKRNWHSYNHNAESQWYIRFCYQSSVAYKDKSRDWREASDFIFYDEELTEELTKKPKEKIMIKPSLYQTKEIKPRYGTFLIKNSTNQTVLEMKGENGKVESFNENDIEIVTPYTVELTALRESVSSIHVISKRNILKKDNVLLELNSSILYRVTKLDSKCLSPRENKSKWMKIPAEFIILEE